MTIEQLLRNDPFFVGFERIADQVNAAAKIAGAQKYPPYNILKADDNSYLIELAVAGFSEKDIDIDSIGSLINQKLREKIQMEAEMANMIKPRGHLPV